MVDQENQAPGNKPTSYQEGKLLGNIKSGISQRGAAQAIGCSCGVLSLKRILLHSLSSICASEWYTHHYRLFGLVHTAPRIVTCSDYVVCSNLEGSN